ncbi:DoxX family protein [Effusibacillus dendaii]|uniref:DoxX family protein n=1 Tax=Effusibacillus dendaii TaxID=2743772 RepID=A0A7I8DAM5_9BACL|nr:DoxX family protein [Effusibacillus dendaii]BCJ87243.1 hypothetical protein skT53_22280 [Effusibacillus dendaii]
MDKLSRFAPTVIRFVLALSFILHGLPKLTNAAQVAPFFEKIGIPLPYQAVIFIGLLEVAGGILLFIGSGTRFVSPLLAIDMLLAILLTKVGKGYVGGYELELLLLAGAVSVFLSGPGAWALQKANKSA